MATVLTRIDKDGSETKVAEIKPITFEVDFKPDKGGLLKVGDEVWIPHFGKGVIVKHEGQEQVFTIRKKEKEMMKERVCASCERKFWECKNLKSSSYDKGEDMKGEKNFELETPEFVRDLDTDTLRASLQIIAKETKKDIEADMAELEKERKELFGKLLKIHTKQALLVGHLRSIQLMENLTP